MADNSDHYVNVEVDDDALEEEEEVVAVEGEVVVEYEVPS